MFCMTCGTQLPGDAQFCYSCGAKIRAGIEEKRDDEFLLDLLDEYKKEEGQKEQLLPPQKQAEQGKRTNSSSIIAYTQKPSSGTRIGIYISLAETEQFEFEFDHILQQYLTDQKEARLIKQYILKDVKGNCYFTITIRDTRDYGKFQKSHFVVDPTGIELQAKGNFEFNPIKLVNLDFYEKETIAQESKEIQYLYWLLLVEGSEELARETAQTVEKLEKRLQELNQAEKKQDRQQVAESSKQTQKKVLQPNGSDDRYYDDYGLQYNIMRAFEDNQENDLIKGKRLSLDAEHGALFVKMPKERCGGLLMLAPEGVPREDSMLMYANILEYAINTRKNRWEIHDTSIEERQQKSSLFSSVLSPFERKDKASHYTHLIYLAVFSYVKSGIYRLEDRWKSPFEYVKPVVLEIPAGHAYTFLVEGW